jgi:mono/diheme cytochrome c family protein
MLKPLLIVSAVVLFGITALSAAGPAPQDAAGQKNPAKPTEKSQARAKELYTQDCIWCHGETGNGKTDIAKSQDMVIGDWTDAKTLAARQDQDLFNSIRNGKGKMPPEASGRAKDDEVWNLIIYIRAMAKGQPAAPSN